MSESVQDAEKQVAGPGKGSLLHTIRAVAWSFIGIRESSAYKEDLAKLNPLHVVAVAITGVVLFIVSLIFFVNWVVAR